MLSMQLMSDSRVCLFVYCRREREHAFFAMMDAVSQIYLASKDRGVSGEEEVELMSESSESRGAKRSKTSSSGSATDKAIDAFRIAMSSMQPPQHKNVPTTAEDFLSQMMLTDEQRTAIIKQLPASSSGPTLSMLSVFDDDLLTVCGLSSLQRSAWRKLSEKLF